MAIDSTQLISTIWNTFRSLMVSNVTSVTIKGSGGANTKTVTLQNTSSSYPDKFYDNESNYPILIINSPKFNFTPTTFRNRELEGTIEFEIFTTQSESADKFVDSINNTLLDNEDTLNSDGLEELELDSVDSNHYERNGINVHSRMVVWRYKFSW